MLSCLRVLVAGAVSSKYVFIYYLLIHPSTPLGITSSMYRVRLIGVEVCVWWWNK